jgi:hypothetical protein
VTTPTPTSDQAGSSPAAAGADDGAGLCTGLTADAAGRVARDDLVELSGLASGAGHQGVLWAHNDSGSRPAVFALDVSGADRGRVEVPVDTPWIDVEDMALAEGQLHLADIGDNDRQRQDVVVYRFAEPDPADTAITGTVDEIHLRYPDGARDAEAFLVDPDTGALVVIDKDIKLALAGDALLSAADANIYVATPPFSPGETVTLQHAGTIALDRLSTETQAPPPSGLVGQIGAAGVATGADISGDGRVIALRTYATVWLFARAEGQSIAEALAGDPCEAPTVPEEQGEAVAFLDGSTSALVTIGEGANPAVNLIGGG